MLKCFCTDDPEDRLAITNLFRDILKIDDEPQFSRVHVSPTYDSVEHSIEVWGQDMVWRDNDTSGPVRSFEIIPELRFSQKYGLYPVLVIQVWSDDDDES